MAFKILSSDELELLTENQRKSYEEELAVYNERVKFVEQMERFEKTVIKPYKPKFVAIPAICDVPEKEFVEPEYVLAKIVPVEKPEPNVAAVWFGDPVTAVVPKHTKIKNVPAGHMKKVEQGKPILPIILKAAAPVNSFARAKQQHPALPTSMRVSIPGNAFKKFAGAKQQHPVLPTSMKVSVPGNVFKKLEQTNLNLPITVKPQNFLGLSFMPVTIDSPVTMAKSPEPVAPAIDILTFTAPRYAAPILPKPAVEFPEINVLESPEQTAPVLPKVIVPKRMEVSLKAYDLDKQADKIEAKLPKTPHIAPVDTLFRKPIVQETKLPVVPKAALKEMIYKPADAFLKKTDGIKAKLPKTLDMPTVKVLFDKPNIQKAELPTAQKAVIPTGEFTVSEHAASDLPMVGIPKANIPLFIAPELQKSTYLTVMKPTVAPKLQGKLSVNSTPKIEYPSINVFFVGPLKKVHSKASGLPIIHVADSPDIGAEEMLKILLPSQKENETRKESFA